MNDRVSRRTSLGAAGATISAGTTVLVFPSAVSASEAEAEAEASKPQAVASKTVRVRLKASESRHIIGGDSVDTWTYNGSLPGPTIRANVGDTIVVDIVNDLPDPTTIHWHGVELPANQDGSNISQDPIPPGGRFTYEFKALTPSLFWYHPHFNTNEQLERGLYGALVIEDPGENKMLGVRPGDEHVLMLDDVLIENGQIAPPFPSDPLANAITHFNGREGNVLLVNGEERPTIRVRNGVPQRLRMVNASNSRFMRVSFGHGQRVWRVGGDAGLLSSPVDVAPIMMMHGGGHGGGHGDGGHGGGHGGGMVSNPDLGQGVMLTPGGRADLIWIPAGAEGEVVSLSLHDWPRGDHGAEYADDGSIKIVHDHTDGKQPPEVLADFRLLGDPAHRPTRMHRRVFFAQWCRWLRPVRQYSYGWGMVRLMPTVRSRSSCRWTPPDRSRSRCSRPMMSPPSLPVMCG